MAEFPLEFGVPRDSAHAQKPSLRIWVLHDTAHLLHVGFSARALCAVSNNAGASSAKVGMSCACRIFRSVADVFSGLVLFFL